MNEHLPPSENPHEELTDQDREQMYAQGPRSASVRVTEHYAGIRAWHGPDQRRAADPSLSDYSFHEILGGYAAFTPDQD